MYTPTSPERRLSNLQQPVPTPQSSQGTHSPNVEWLEQSAERMSLHSSSGGSTRRGYTSHTRKKSDSRRSSLRSKPQFNSGPTHPYQNPSPWDHAPESNMPAPAYDKRRVYTEPISHAQRDRQLSQEQGSGPHGSFQSPSEDQYFVATSQARTAASRGPSSTTNSTMKHAGSLFRDFDGTHYTTGPSRPIEGYVMDRNDIEERAFTEEEPESLTNNDMIRQLERTYDEAARDAELEQEWSHVDEEPLSARVDIMPSQDHNLKWVEPPPAENMVYYPAPVPMQLNRPKRLSQLPPSTLSAQRRSQVLGSIPAKARQSAVWLPEMDDLDEQPEPEREPHETGQSRSKQRQSALNLQKLPPQLRASVFFDQQSVPHKVQVKHGSAVATLDSLLDASAKAPPNATIDDTMRVAEANMKHQRNKSSTSLLGLKSDDPRKSRLSLLPFRKASADTVSQLRQRASSAFGFDATKYDAVGEEDEDERAYDYGDSDDEEQLLADGNSDGGYSFEEDRDEDYRPLEDDEFPVDHEEHAPQGPDFAEAPTTLLAELQLRKQQLRSRNRTAATSFPNGMHSTLLELDAVAQIEKKNRKGVRTTLAWEDPNSVAAAKEKAEDENVPLAMLYPTKTGLVNKAGGSDWDRPLGLLAKRDMEESEPLSKRRNRLKGINPNAAKLVTPQNVDAGEEDSEHEGETLAQRTRRLKSTKALDDAIGDGQGKQLGNDFATDVISQFGGLKETTANDPETRGNAVQDLPAEEETLGQRRKRLQAEAKAAQAAAGDGGLANLLSSNTVGAMRQVSNESTGSGLVGQSEQSRLQRQNQIYQQNYLSSSNLLTTPLINSQQPMERQKQTYGLLGANEHLSQSRRQQLQDTNQRISTVGIDQPLVGQQRAAVQSFGLLARNEQDRVLRQQNVAQHNQFGQPVSIFNDQLDILKRQTRTNMGPRYNDGSGGVTPMRATSAFPHMQTQSSLQTRGFSSSGFGLSPQQPNLAQNFPYGQQSMAQPDGQMMHTQSMQTPPMSSLQVQDIGQESLSSKQRENIDRWRQSVMH